MAKNRNQPERDVAKEEGDGDATGYEQVREKRMKENMERMQKSGIIDLASTLKKPSPKKIKRAPSEKKTTLPSSDPPRRSSRFGAMKEAESKGADTKSSKLAFKKAEDPNKPKRPSSAFFVFMEGFRKEYQKSHPENKSVSVVGKAGGDKWKSMSDAEKAPFQEQAEQNIKEYKKTMVAYNKKLAEGNADDEESDKSKSEINDENDEDGSKEEDDD